MLKEFVSDLPLMLAYGMLTLFDSGDTPSSSDRESIEFDRNSSFGSLTKPSFFKKPSPFTKPTFSESNLFEHVLNRLLNQFKT